MFPRFALPPIISKPRLIASKLSFHDSVKLHNISTAKHAHDASPGAATTHNMLSSRICLPSAPNDTTTRVREPPHLLQFRNYHTFRLRYNLPTACERYESYGYSD